MKLEYHSVKALQDGIASVFINIMFMYINFCSFFKELGIVG